MLGNRRMSARDLADAAGISINLSVPFFTDILGLKYIRSRLVPKQFFQKERRVKICEEMLYDYKLVMKRIITGNVTWIYAYYPKTSDQYREYRAKGQAKPKRSHQSKSKIKATLTVLSDYCGVVHLVQPTKSIIWMSSIFCVKLFARRGLNCELTILGFCNAIMRLLTLSMHILTQPLYSPDLTTSLFWQLPKLERLLQENHFETVQEIPCALKAIPEGTFRELENTLA